MTDQGPVIQPIKPAHRALLEKPGARQTGHGDFGDVMNRRFQHSNHLPERELKNDAEIPAEVGRKRHVEDTNPTPVELSAAPPLEFQLAVHHGVLLKWAESHEQGGALAGDRPLPSRVEIRKPGNTGVDENDWRRNSRDGLAADAGRRLADLKLSAPGQLAGPPLRQVSAIPSVIRVTADPGRRDSDGPFALLRLDQYTGVERPEHPLRAPTERSTSTGQDAPHDQPGKQQDAPAVSAFALAGQTLLAEFVSSPAAQISHRLSQVLTDMARDSKAPVTSTIVKSLQIVLEPEQLGIVHVSLTLRAEGLHVRIAAGEATTADALRRDRHQLDGLLRPMGVDGSAALVTISIVPIQESPSTAPGPSAEQRTPFGSVDQDFHHSGPGHGRHPGTERQARENGPSSPASRHEDYSPARSDRPGTMVV